MSAVPIFLTGAASPAFLIPTRNGFSFLLVNSFLSTALSLRAGALLDIMYGNIESEIRVRETSSVNRQLEGQGVYASERGTSVATVAGESSSKAVEGGNTC
ncbi:hypothetical protein BOTBODRAFT_342230 [Botryobasidium botryosum FD-172 SS1]|uniref:Uncharacterized protein n=1 Tax=Botryobasidium botryosum (strain FD-172 SS1) TaxID=930990 RepID=A0A067MG11_BOTB1|nr:hypothetical protein BOTBODRAFT_342230 [Botryobasidium botryosum FD-172 SS1]